MDGFDESLEGLAAKWRRSRQLVEAGNRAGSDFPEWRQVCELEREVLRDPIRTFDDAIAKLQAVELSFSDEPRTDGADASALCQAAVWLRAHCGAGFVCGSGRAWPTGGGGRARR